MSRFHDHNAKLRSCNYIIILYIYKTDYIIDQTLFIVFIARFQIKKIKIA